MAKRKFEGSPRIYVVVAGTIDGQHGQVVQPVGRQFAQGVHVVSRMRYQFARQHPNVLWSPITTIVLQARDSNELRHVEMLLRKNKIAVMVFFDTNPEYGFGEFATAICTEAIYKQETVGIVDYLPLWGSDLWRPNDR